MDPVQRVSEDRSGSEYAAFRKWAIGVACVYGLVTCVVCATAGLLAVSGEPSAWMSTGYSPQFTSAEGPADRGLLVNARERQ